MNTESNCVADRSRRTSVDVRTVDFSPAWQYAETDLSVALRQTVPAVGVAELNRAAQLDWAVYQTPAFAFIPNQIGDLPQLDADGFVNVAEHPGRFALVGRPGRGSQRPVPDYFLNVREDNNRVIGIVRQRYRVVQNADAPSLLETIVGAGEGQFHAAGELRGGAQVWWLLRLAGEATIAADRRERLESFVLLSNSHDGSSSLGAAAIALRSLSSSTLVWPLPSARRTLTVRHTDSARDQSFEAQRILTLVRGYQKQLTAISERLLATRLTPERFLSFIGTLVPTPKPRRSDGRVVNQRGITMAENTKSLITQIYFEHETLEHVRGSLWAAVQAVQFYSDHLTINRTTDDATAGENRFKRLTSEPNLGSRAFVRALNLLS